jgi:hypothetical protein
MANEFQGQTSWQMCRLSRFLIPLAIDGKGALLFSRRLIILMAKNAQILSDLASKPHLPPEDARRAAIRQALRHLRRRPAAAGDRYAVNGSVGYIVGGYTCGYGVRFYEDISLRVLASRPGDGGQGKGGLERAGGRGEARGAEGGRAPQPLLADVSHVRQKTFG